MVVVAGLDVDAWATDPSFGETEAAHLRDFVARGARGLKVWKTLGLRARGPDGRLVAVDDPRLDPLWVDRRRAGRPRGHPHRRPGGLLRAAGPDERAPGGAPRPSGLACLAGPARRPPRRPRVPGFDDLLAAFGRLVGAHPRTTFIGAHVGCAAEDLALVARLLDEHPNLHVDIAARLGELGRQPYTARAFFLRYADRILFGADLGPDPATYALHYRFLETFDESFDYGTDPVPTQGRWQIHGIGLPDDVLRRVYRDNARRLFAMGPA